MTPQSFTLQRTVLSMLLGTSVLFLSACGDKAPTTPASATAEGEWESF